MTQLAYPLAKNEDLFHFIIHLYVDTFKRGFPSNRSDNIDNGDLSAL